MAEFAALPLFTDAWVADTAHLTRVERGLYMDLLVLCWRSPECRIPNDLAWIDRKLGCDEEEVLTLKKLIAEFMSSTGNWLTQKRLKKEFNYIREKRQKFSDWAKLRKNKQKDTSLGNATNTDVCSAPTPTPTPTKRDIDTNVSISRPTNRACALPLNWTPTIESWGVVRDMGFTEDDQNFMLAEMRDWATAHGKTMKNWDSCYRNWARKALKNGKPAKPRSNTFADGFAKVDAVIEERRRREHVARSETGGADIVELSRLREGAPRVFADPIGNTCQPDDLGDGVALRC